MPGMDIFEQDAFSTVELTAAVNDLAYVPGRIGQLGVFEERGVRTTRVSVEKKDNALALIPTTQRGSSPVKNVKDQRTIRDVSTVRVALSDDIYADEVQNIRSFGSESELQGVQEEVADRQFTMTQKMDATMEHHRIGAIKGIVYDADGSTVILNLFTFFGVSAIADVDFDLSVSADGVVRNKCNSVLRSIEDELGGIPYTGVIGFCGSTFFDEFTANVEVRDSYKVQEGPALRERTARRSIFFGGILFEEYRGSVGGVAYVGAGDCQFFPVGCPGLFLTRYAPADYWDTVNTRGIPRYSRQFGDPTGADRYRTVEVQTNVLHLCTRPRVLIKGTNT
jgi:hypothetical protein